MARRDLARRACAAALPGLAGLAAAAGPAAAPATSFLRALSTTVTAHAGRGSGADPSPSSSDRGTAAPGGGGARPPRPPPPSLADAGALAASDALWPTSRRQKAVASRIRRALAAVLADPAAAGLRGPDVHTLTARCGLALGGVRAGPDGRTAHILYDVTPGTEAAAAAVLSGPLAGPLRSAVGRALGARRAPVLKWSPDRLGGSAAAVLAELDRLGLPSNVK